MARREVIIDVWDESHAGSDTKEVKVKTFSKLIEAILDSLENGNYHSMYSMLQNPLKVFKQLDKRTDIPEDFKDQVWNALAAIEALEEW